MDSIRSKKTKSGTLCFGMLILVLAAFGAVNSSAQVVPCTVQGLTPLHPYTPNTTIKSATTVPADKKTGLPEYCDVFGTIFVTVDSTVTNVGFELRMPTANWNGKLYFRPSQGFSGRVARNTSIGLKRNYATLSTDTGHTINNPALDIEDGSWALNNHPAEVNFGYLAVHETTVVGKQIIQTYYGSGPGLSYLDGCSNGGRHGLVEAQLYPADFDGIIAGNPVLDHTGLIIGFVWDMQALHATDKTSGTDIPLVKLPVIGNAVLAQCDAIDGLVDGLIDDPRKCNFDPETLLCPTGVGDNCLTAVQVDALKKIYAGPSNSKGKQIYPGFPVGGETPDTSDNGWDFWLVNANLAPHFKGPNQFIIMNQFLWYLAFNPDQPNFDFNTFNFDTDPKLMKEAAGLFNATNTDLSGFRQAGGKLLMYQGWSDPAQSALRTIEYFEDLQDANGNTDDFARLFMAPGMYHCFGGPGPNTFNTLIALEKWVEEGKAPGELDNPIIATHFKDNTGKPDRTRPLCHYPEVAIYNGSGDINDAANFHCGQR